MLLYKKRIGKIKLKLMPGKASTASTLSAILGQKGLNISDFCKNFNNMTLKLKNNLELSVKVNYFKDKVYEILIKSPTIASYLKDFFNLKKITSCNLNVNFFEILKIINLKLKDFNTNNIHSNIKTVIGVFKSFKIVIKNEIVEYL